MLRSEAKWKILWDSSSHLDENYTLFSFDTNDYNSSGSAGTVLAEFCTHHGEGQAGMRLGKEEGAVESWGDSFGRGSGMCIAGKAAVAAGCLYMVLFIRSQFSFSTLGFPEVTNQQTVCETQKLYSVTVWNTKLYNIELLLFLHGCPFFLSRKCLSCSLCQNYALENKFICNNMFFNWLFAYHFFCFIKRNR